MGASQSTESHPPTRALHVLRVTPSSPAAIQTDIEPFFDFVVGYEGDSLNQHDIDAAELEKIVETHEGRTLKLLVWSSKNQNTRVVPIIPSRAWSATSQDSSEGLKPSLLGLSMRLCEPEHANVTWHVLDVIQGSPGESAGLVPYGDYIIGWSGGVLGAENDFYDLVEQHIDKPLRVYVYSYDFDCIREVVLIPNRHWGGEGLLGCVFGFGLLHRIPPQATDHIPGAIPPDLQEDEDFEDLDLFVPADAQFERRDEAFGQSAPHAHSKLSSPGFSPPLDDSVVSALQIAVPFIPGGRTARYVQEASLWYQLVRTKMLSLLRREAWIEYGLIRVGDIGVRDTKYHRFDEQFAEADSQELTVLCVVTLPMRFFPFILGAAAVVQAYSETSPLVVWSSHSPLGHLPGSTSADVSKRLLQSIFLHPEICNVDTVVVIDQPGLHASDLRSLSASSHVVRALSKAESSRQYPYLPCSKLHNDTISALPSYASSVSSNCNSRLLQLSLGQDLIPFDGKTKYTVILSMPSLDISRERYSEFHAYDQLLSSLLDDLISEDRTHLVVYAGSPHSAAIPADDMILTPLIKRATAPTLKGTGILHKYQLLTPGLITGLLVTLGVFLPIVLTAIRTLHSIQTPTSGGAPKGFSATEKKTQ